MPGASSLRVAIIGCGRMAGTIDDEVQNYPGMLFPYGHAGAYRQVPDVELAAIADVDPARLSSFGDRFGVPARYTDYRRMIEEARPDILSITTHATHRAEMICFAAAHGVRAIYAEKALACSLAETDAIMEACRRNSVAFNIGTSRRYHPGYRAVRELIEQGAIGEARLAIAYTAGDLMHTHSHTIDTLLFLLGDPEVKEVQARLATASSEAVNRRYPSDPRVEWAAIECVGGRRAMIIAAPGRYEFEVIGSGGAIQAYNNGYTWQMRLPDRQGRHGKAVWESASFPEVDQSVSPTLRCVRELVAAVQEGAPTSGNLEIARRQMEVSAAAAESHLAGGRAVFVPVERRDVYLPSR